MQLPHSSNVVGKVLVMHLRYLTW